MRVETVVEATETFLADLGVDLALPPVGAFCQHLIRALASSARHADQDLTFTDLYAVSRSTQALRAFLMDVHSLSSPDAQELLAQLDDDAGYVQAVTILSAIRTALGPLEAGPLRALSQPPFLNVNQFLSERSLLLVPMTDTDFPRHDRLLSAMLDLTLNRILATQPHPSLSAHCTSTIPISTARIMASDGSTPPGEIPTSPCFWTSSSLKGTGQEREASSSSAAPMHWPLPSSTTGTCLLPSPI